QAKILEAEGEAQAIQLVNQAADKYFVGNAQLLRKLIAVETSLSTNSKIVVPANTQLINIVGDMAGLLPANGVSPLSAPPPSASPPDLVSSRFVIPSSRSRARRKVPTKAPATDGPLTTNQR